MNSRVAVAALLVAAFVAGAALAVPSSAQSGTYDIDGATGLTDEATIQEYGETGNVTVSTVTPQMEFQVAESSEAVGLSGIEHTDFDTTYLRVEHKEGIERTVRVYIPEEYWHPHPAEIESETSDHVATLEPAEDGNVTAVEIHFDGKGEAVIPVARQASAVFSIRDSVNEWWEQETGVDLPQLSDSGGQWEYIPTSQLTGEPPTVAIDLEGKDDPAIQYDAANADDPSNKEWRTVPACDSTPGEDAGVCTFTRDGDSKLYLLAQDEPAPDIRYKYNPTLLDRMKSAVPGVGDAFGQFVNDVQETLDEILPDF